MCDVSLHIRAGAGPLAAGTGVRRGSGAAMVRRYARRFLTATGVAGCTVGTFLVARTAALAVMTLLTAVAGGLACAALVDALTTEVLLGGAVAAGHRRLRGLRHAAEPDDGTDAGGSPGAGPHDGSGDVVEVRLLGPLVVRLADGVPVADARWRSAKNLDVLRMLALAGRPVRVDELTRTLWPDADERRAAASLRTAVFELRRLVGARRVVRSGEHLHLTDVWVDVDAYRALAVQSRHAAAEGLAASCLTFARQAEALHLGPVAPRATDAILVGDWVQGLERLRRDVILDAGQAAVTVGRPEQAVDLLRSYLLDDTLCERAYRGLMEAYAALGETGLALAAYETCRRALADELGADPSPLTHALHARLLAGPGDAPTPTDTRPGRPFATTGLLRRLHAELPDAWLEVLHLLATAREPLTPGQLRDLAGAEVDLDAALGRLTDLGLLAGRADGALDLADPVLRRALCEWLRPRRREALARRATAAVARAAAARDVVPDAVPAVDPDPATDPAGDPAADLYRRALAALAARRLDAARALARQAAQTAQDPVGRLRAATLELLPDALLGTTSGDLHRTAAALEAECARWGARCPADLRARAGALALLAAPGRPDTDRVDAVVAALGRDEAWLAAPLLVRTARGEQALLLAATWGGYAEPLHGSLMRLATARLHLAAGEPRACLGLLRGLLRDPRADRLVLPEACATVAALTVTVEGDPARAATMLERYEELLGADGERPVERIWRLTAVAALRSATGRDAGPAQDAARRTAAAAGLALPPPGAPTGAAPADLPGMVGVRSA